MNFVYNGIEYDVGTKVKIQTIRYGEQIMTLRQGGVTGIEFVGENLYSIPIRSNTSNIVIEIVDPIYVQTQSENDAGKKHRTRPAPWDVETGWIWYVIIMIVGAIFKDRLLIWAVASAIFFLWKNGFMNKNNNN